MIGVTVKDLIEHLKTKPQDLLVGYRCCSEQCLLKFEDIVIQQCCDPRSDGWLQDKRPDKAYKNYLIFPGN